VDKDLGRAFDSTRWRSSWSVYALMEELHIDRPSRLAEVLREQGIDFTMMPPGFRRGLEDGLRAERDGLLDAWIDKSIRWRTAIVSGCEVSELPMLRPTPLLDRPLTRHDVLDYMALSGVSSPCDILDELRSQLSPLYEFAREACEAYREGQFKEWVQGKWSPQEIREFRASPRSAQEDATGWP
jgi:hypothetical protein